jgi:CSLREA domain-containing protein
MPLDVRGRLAMGLCVAALCAPASAGATVYTVNTTADPQPDGECLVDCTLREAVNAAGAADSVAVPPGTYALAAGLGELVVNTDTIRGAGARTTVIRAAPSSRVIRINAEARASITGVTITGGAPVAAAAAQQGGGILIGAGAILLLLDSAVVGNSADVAGGIMATGALGMVRSTVSGNVATTAQGGGIGIASGVTATLTNSTVSGNRAETIRSGLGGGIISQGTLTLDNVTVANNRANSGGGIYQNPAGQTPTSATIRDTIVAGNTGGDCAGTAAVIAAWQGDHNLDQDGTCGFSAVGDRPGVNPLLGTLADNGGSTNTHALAAGSPAINAGDPASCQVTDQRGVARPGGGCDIGAFEYVAPSTPGGGGGGGLPDPVFHKNVNALPKSGTVRIKLPGTRRFRVLSEGEQIPLGTIVDVRKGRVTIVAAAGGDQTAVFYGGIFKLSQTKGEQPITVLRLVEKLSCKSAKKATAAAKKKRKRRLWGNGSGRFRTKGKHSAATVVGTKWLVQDRCTSTLTRVVRGRVKVRDFAKKKTVFVKAGKRYVARSRR